MDETKEIPIASLKTDQSPRLAGANKAHIHILASTLSELPPILVHAETMQVIDGVHRLKAAQLNGASSVKVRFFSGSDDDAFVAAVQSNIAHGLPLTLLDRKTAAKRILKSHPDQSDRWVAVTTGISAGTVASIRRLEVATEDSELEKPRIGLDGKTRPMNSATGRLTAQRAILENPGASLRDIARISGISPQTVRDVRKRMVNGGNVVPAAETEVRGRPVRARSFAKSGVHEIDGPDSSEQPIDQITHQIEGIMTLLEKLRKDPSIRHTEVGRVLLRSLDAYAQASRHCIRLASDIPPHYAYIVAEYAHRCAETWLIIARQLEKRMESFE